MFCVYALQSKKDRNLYIGFTNNLRKRLTKHANGKVFSTKSRRPLLCIYTEICLNEHDARKKERYLKSGQGKRFIKQRLYHYFKNVTESTENT